VARQLHLSGSDIYAAMGNRNPSISRYATSSLICSEVDWEKILEYAIQNRVDLAFIGPDPVLATPLVDSLIEKGIPTASPSRSAARIETDKIFMRDMLSRHRIPGNIENQSFESEADCRKWISSYDGEFVVKPRGLTGGKGVKVMGDHFSSRQEGMDYALQLIRKDGSVLIEEKLSGEEFSLQAFSDGSRMVAMPLAQDYKRSLPGDRGPNTGGMGSITDHDHLLPFIDRSSRDAALDIMRRVSNAMQKEGMPFRGIMYGQFMLTRSGTKLIEINARFADPEGINVLSILEDDLVEILFGIAGGSMKAEARFANKATVLRYAVPRGYGSDPLPGSINIDDPGRRDALIYYASVNGTLNHVEMTKSRTLALVGIADSIREAGLKVDALVSHVHGDFYMRKDIGTEEMLSEKMKHLKD